MRVALLLVLCALWAAAQTDPRVMQATAAVQAADLAMEKAKLERDRAQLDVRVASTPEEKATSERALADREAEFQRTEIASERSKLALRAAELAVREALVGSSTSNDAPAPANASTTAPTPVATPSPAKAEVAPPNPVAAATLAEVLPSAQQGDANAQYEVGRIFDEGRGLKRNAPEAIVWLEKAAVQGHVEASVLLASRYLEAPPGYQVNPVRARELLSAPVEKRAPDAIYWLAEATENAEERAKLYQQGSLLGQPNAMLEYAFLLLEGTGGVSKNTADGMHLMQLALATNNPKVITRLAGAYYYGREWFSSDKIEAIALLRRAAEVDAGNAYELSRHLYFNESLPDSSTWPYWLQTAAARGHLYAQKELGSDFVDGTLSRNGASREQNIEEGSTFAHRGGGTGRCRRLHDIGRRVPQW